jgi:hypothetical protein
MLPLLGCKRNGAPTTEERLSDVHKARARVFVPERFVMQADHEEEARQAGYRQLDLIYRRLEDQMAVLAAQTNPDGRPVWRLFGRRTVADAFLYVMCRWKDKSPRPSRLTLRWRPSRPGWTLTRTSLKRLGLRILDVRFLQAFGIDPAVDTTDPLIVLAAVVLSVYRSVPVVSERCP